MVATKKYLDFLPVTFFGLRETDQSYWMITIIESPSHRKYLNDINLGQIDHNNQMTSLAVIINLMNI